MCHGAWVDRRMPRMLIDIADLGGPGVSARPVIILWVVTTDLQDSAAANRLQ